MKNKAAIRLWDGKNKNRLLELLQLNTPKFFASAEAKDFDAYLDHSAEAYFTVEENGLIVGCGGINYGFDEGKSARLSWDIIHPEKQGMGYGSALVKHRLKEITNDKAVKRVVVRTTPEQAKFYEKFRFKQKHVKKDYWSPGYDLCEMELSFR